MLHQTSAGYVAIRADEEDAATLLAPSNAIKKARWIVATIGCVLFFTVLTAVYSSGHKDFFFPLVGITFALVVFSFRTLELVASRSYRHRLRAHEQAGRLVCIPAGLVVRAHGAYRAKEQEMPQHLFDYNFTASLALAELYAKDKRSPQVQQQLEELIGQCPAKT